MKSATPWTDANNPGPHRPVGLNAQLTHDAETIYDAGKMEYLSQLNVTQAIINALNVAVPKEFKLFNKLTSPLAAFAHLQMLVP